MLKNIKQLFRHTIIYGFGNVSVKIIGLILIPLYTNPKYFSVKDFGAISLLEVSVQLLVALLGLSVYQALTRLYWDANYSKVQKSLFYTVLVFNILFIIIIGFPFILFSEHLSVLLFEDTSFSYVLKVMYLSVFFQVISQALMTLMKLQSKSTLYSITNIIKLFVTLIITIYFVIYLKRGIKGIFEAQVLGYIPYFIHLAGYTIKNIVFRFNGRMLRELIVYSLPLMLGSVSGTVLTIFDRYSLNYLATLDDVGIYSLGYKFANTIKIALVTSVQLAVSPMIFQKMNDKDNKRFYSKLLTYQSFIVTIAVLFFSLFGYEMIAVFTSDDIYLKAAYIIPVISTSILFGMMKDTALTGLQIIKRTGIIGLVILIISLINMGLNILLIPYLKIHGASLSTLLSQVIFFIVIYWIAQKNYPIPYEIRKVVLLVLIIAVYCLLTFILNRYAPLIRVPIKMLLLVAFPFVLKRFKFYEAIEIQSLNNAWNKWKNPLKWKKYLSVKNNSD